MSFDGFSEITKKFQVNSKAIPKNSGDEKIVSEKKKKIRERLINLLRGRPSLDSLREKGIFKGMNSECFPAFVNCIQLKYHFLTCQVNHLRKFFALCSCLDEPVFGCDLQSLCSREENFVPKFVQQCIQAIEQKGLEADGIYRVCGNLSEVQKIRYQVNHGKVNEKHSSPLQLPALILL